MSMFVDRNMIVNMFVQITDPYSSREQLYTMDQ